MMRQSTPAATLDFAVLRRWIGKRQSTTDIIRAQPVVRMQATLDGAATTPRDGEPLPAAWHWLFFLDATPLRELDRDGHAARGEFLPPVALPRRMWAGGRLRFREPMRIGETIRKQSTIQEVVRKTGRTGELCFVTVRHEFSCGAQLKMIEEHDIVYRHDHHDHKHDHEHDHEHAPASVSAAPTDADASRQITPTRVMLFRYSALTFNSHRIHYDAEYCRDVEGFPDVVVHGPLTATWLVAMASEQCGAAALGAFEFRAHRPLFADQPITIACKKQPGQLQLWAANARGELAMRATATLLD